MENYSTFMGHKTQYFKMSVFPNLFYRLNTVLFKIPASCFLDIDRMILM